MTNSTISAIIPFELVLCKFAINLSFLEFIKNHHQKLHNLKGTKYLLIKSPFIPLFYFHFFLLHTSSTFIHLFESLSHSLTQMMNFLIFIFYHHFFCMFLLRVLLSLLQTFITIPLFFYYFATTLDISSYPI